jgi:uncharacterized protein (TIGR02145 family)
MAENLAYLPSVNGETDSSSIVAKYYVYDYDGTSVSTAKASSNYTTYGVLYNWPAAMAGAASSTTSPSGVRGACPYGWHLPSGGEWNALEDYVGGVNQASTKLQANSTLWGLNTGTDNYGFSALPGGYNYGTSFIKDGAGGYWWTATEYDVADAFGRYMFQKDCSVYSYNEFKFKGFSLRCVKDL